MRLDIQRTTNPAIIKLEAPVILVKGSYQFTTEEQAENSPLAKELLAIPFIKTVFISANFIALEALPIVEWDDVAQEVALQVEAYLRRGAPILIDNIPEEAVPLRKIPVTIYVESTPNPMAMKFVANKKLVSRVYEYKSAQEAAESPLAAALFKFPYVKEVFFDSNYISVIRQPKILWEEVMMELREFIRQYLMAGKPVVRVIVEDGDRPKGLPTLNDIYSRKIIAILDQYIKPAVSSDGGNIQFVSYDKESQVVKVLMQGACNGCPSSKLTLKQGIEAILREKMKNERIVVEAIN
ncbi:NifU family protein [Capnocytophaga sp. oral taxon 338]|uniref:NifU family protein n=1 Tax=Capnocytophaga sp. oral taxon 338 TaxID=710239 RepID=UPI000202E4AD|nr:NifU family protein [Capnocytophaga sp. oral taxon 338]EGD34832.1 nitrogen-fixing NifU domain protein [Capnocytophaga sp. oral taxon 338 str. F0234]